MDRTTSTTGTITSGVSKSNGQDKLYDWHNDTQVSARAMDSTTSTTGTMTPGVSKRNGEDSLYDWHNDTMCK
jgi:hypothetical protein